MADTVTKEDTGGALTINYGPVYGFKVGQKVSVWHPNRRGYDVFAIDADQDGVLSFARIASWLMENDDSGEFTLVSGMDE